MIGHLLVRGMLIGLLAGLLSFAFLKVYGEPAVDRAIAFESAMDAAKAKAKADEAKAKGLPAPSEAAEAEIVSRPVQAGFGLFTAVTIYSTAFGGLFALAFAFAFGRMGAFGPRATAALLAAAGLIAVYVIPNLKYPANPPSVGNPETIGMRTGYYFAMIAISLAAMIGAGKLRLWLKERNLGAWDTALLAAVAYVLVVLVVGYALPTVNEVPEGFPATVLWQFRMASLGAQLIMWTTLGLGLGAVLERNAASSSSRSALPRPT